MRVSTPDQTFELQTDELTAAGCEKQFTDIASGARTERPGLAKAIEFCRPKDVLVVWKLDRMGRSLSHLIETVKMLEQRGIGFRSLTENIDTTTSSGRLIFCRFRGKRQCNSELNRQSISEEIGALFRRKPAPLQPRTDTGSLFYDNVTHSGGQRGVTERGRRPNGVTPLWLIHFRGLYGPVIP